MYSRIDYFMCPIKEQTEASTYLKPPQKTWHKLIDLHQTNVLPNTRPRPHTKMEHRRLHLFSLFLSRLDPSFGPVRIDVISEDLGPAMDNPRITSHDRSAGDVLAADIDALGRDDAFEWEAGGWVQAEGLFNAGVEVGKLLRFRPADKVVGAILDDFDTDGGVEFVHEFLVATGMLEEIVEYGREAYAGGFGAGESHTDGHGEDAAVVEEVGAVFLRF